MTLIIGEIGRLDREETFQRYLKLNEIFVSEKRFLGYEAITNTRFKTIVVPFGLEKTVSYGGGTKNGPNEIIKASHQVELFDEELNKEPYKNIGIKTLKQFKIKKKVELALKQLAEINDRILKLKKLPFVLGGEHSITPGSIEPLVKKYKNVVILHFDAHADLRDRISR